MGNNQYPPLPSPIGEGATLFCHCERQNGASQSHNSCNINGITTQTSFAHNDKESLCNTQVSGAAAALPRNDKLSSRFTLHSSLKICAAFTLAEVLITLGIIGIVAALTIPSIVAGVQKEILKNQFKKTYSTFSNAVMRVQSDWGTPVNCYYWDSSPYSGKCTATCKPEDKLDNGGCSNYICKETGESIPSDYNGNMDDCRKFHEELLYNYLKVTKFCKNNALANGCLTSDYRGANKVLEEQKPDADIPDGTFSDSWIKNESPVAILNDGSIIIPLSMAWSPVYTFDVNGHKGPNKWGYDILSVQIVGNETDGIRKIQGISYAIEKGGTSSKDILLNR